MTACLSNRRELDSASDGNRLALPHRRRQETVVPHLFVPHVDAVWDRSPPDS